MGIPVVSSSEAARGVQATPGEHLLVGRDNSDFAAKVIQLLCDAELRRQMAASARTQLRIGHSWIQSMQLLDIILQQKHSPSHSNDQEALPAMRV